MARAITAEQTIRGWRLTAAREAVGIGSVRLLAIYLREHAERQGSPPPRGLSERTINNIEAGRATLSPQAAEYIARALGISPTFFNAPIERLGDVLAGSEAVGSTAKHTPLAGAATSLAEDLLAAAEPALDQLDALLDRRADGEPPGLPDSDADAQPRTGTDR